MTNNMIGQARAHMRAPPKFQHCRRYALSSSVGSDLSACTFLKRVALHSRTCFTRVAKDAPKSPIGSHAHCNANIAHSERARACRSASASRCVDRKADTAWRPARVRTLLGPHSGLAHHHHESQRVRVACAPSQPWQRLGVAQIVWREVAHEQIELARRGVRQQ